MEEGLIRVREHHRPLAVLAEAHPLDLLRHGPIALPARRPPANSMLARSCSPRITRPLASQGQLASALARWYGGTAASTSERRCSTTPRYCSRRATAIIPSKPGWKSGKM